MQKKPVKRIGLIRLFQLITVASLIVLAVVMMFLHINASSREFKARAETMRSNYLEQQKNMIKHEVTRVVAMIHSELSRSEQETRKTVEQRVREAYAVAENIYQKNRQVKSDKEIQQLIVEALRAIRFENKTGYYFIVDFKGISRLHAAHPDFEGTSVLDFQDTQHQFIIRNMLEIVKRNKEGFYEYYWEKPGEVGPEHKKIAYVKAFEPFDWYIGTGLYVEDIEARIKANLLSLISKISFGKKGYIFVDGFDGEALVTNGKVLSGSQKLWELFGKNPEDMKMVFKRGLAAARKPDGDYIYYLIGKSPGSRQEFSKVSFVYGVPELQWLVGAGAYLDEIENDIAALQTKLENQRRSDLQQIVIVTAILIFCSLLLLQVIGRFLLKEFNLFSVFYRNLVQDNQEIDCSSIHFEEFYQVACSANLMLQDKLSVQEKLKLSEEKYRIFFENSANAMLMIHDGKFVDCNVAALDLLGYEDKESFFNVRPEALSPELQPDGKPSAAEADRMMQIAMEKGTHRFEWRHKRQDGEVVAVEVSLTAVPVDGEMLLHVVWWDLSQRKKAEALLHKSEERFRTMAELLPEAIFETDVALNLVYANKQALDLYGYTADDFAKGMKSIDMFAPEEIPKLMDNVAEQFRGEKTSRTEYLSLKKDGSVFPTLFRVAPIIKDGKPDGIRGVVIDLTEQKKAAKLLEESEERFRTLADLLPEAVFEVDSQMMLTYGNQRAFELYGYTEEEFPAGLNGLTMFAPEEHERVLQNITAQYRGEKNHSTEYLAMKKDGTVFPALFHVSPIVKDGKPAGLRGVAIDLTELRQAEEEILKLRKLESVGILAGGIAHDFNNLLAGLFGNIEMAKRFLAEEDKAYKYLQSAGMSMERATSLTQQLLTFAKGGDPIKDVLFLPGMIEEIARFSLRGSNVKLQLDIPENLWAVDADKGQLSQVISNLVINAKQAMPEGGVVTISAENLETAAGKSVKILLRDQGIGISPQDLDKIFDPYFSTKQRGSGLGLASCYSIITKHNGKIEVSSELNRGTTFTIILPATTEDKKPRVDDPETEPVGENNIVARILVLDDEEMLQQMSGTMLEEMGHQVGYASHGGEAVDKYRAAQEQGAGYDVVICDLTIPGGMGGQAAAQEILRSDPQAKLIVSSGYATDSVMANYAEYGFCGRVAKPYLFEELQKVIQQVLKNK